MPRVSAFRGLVFDAHRSGPLDRVTAPPYDVISDARRRELLTASPFSVVHLDLAEGPEDPAHPESRYARAAQLLVDWEAKGVLRRTPDRAFYAYEMTVPSDGPARSIRGALVAMDLEPLGASVLPHEDVMPGPVLDRLHLLRATHTHLSPIYGTIAGPCDPFGEILARAVDAAPLLEVLDEQGVTHRLWTFDADEPVAAMLQDQPLMIADGHHRYATALAYRDERHATDGPGPWDRLLTLVVDAGAQPIPVLPFHRLQMSGEPPREGEAVPDLKAALARLSDDGLVVATVTRAGDGARYRVLELSGPRPAVRALHAGPLSELTATLGLRFVADAAAAETAVLRGEAVAAWLLPPTTPERIRRLAERGERLPEKSTYFWPKPRTGMVMMPLD